MDPITFAIVTSILGNLSYDVIKKVYTELKAAIEHKYGAGSDILEALNRLEEKPDSKSRQSLFQQEVTNTKADQDPELLGIANDLLEKLNQIPSARVKINQQIKIKGDRNIVTGQGDVTLNE